MPLFEFVCKKCGNKFEKIIFSINNEEIKCPSCGSNEAEKQFSVFSSSSSSASGSHKGHGHQCSGGCCGGHCHH